MKESQINYYAQKDWWLKKKFVLVEDATKENSFRYYTAIPVRNGTLTK